MKKFNNTLEGTDCGDAGLSTPCRNTATSDKSLRIISKRPENGATVIQFLSRRANPVRQQRAQDIGRWKKEVR
jgi:hypothetical protein